MYKTHNTPFLYHETVSLDCTINNPEAWQHHQTFLYIVLQYHPETLLTLILLPQCLPKVLCRRRAWTNAGQRGVLASSQEWLGFRHSHPRTAGKAPHGWGLGFRHELL